MGWLFVLGSGLCVHKGTYSLYMSWLWKQLFLCAGKANKAIWQAELSLLQPSPMRTFLSVCLFSWLCPGGLLQGLLHPLRSIALSNSHQPVAVCLPIPCPTQHSAYHQQHLPLCLSLPPQLKPIARVEVWVSTDASSSISQAEMGFLCHTVPQEDVKQGELRTSFLSLTIISCGLGAFEDQSIEWLVL